jgi:predicted transposase/invertase (TIGR01784 family)
MRRDPVFYQLFRQFPILLFELLPQPPADAGAYTFDSVEVKETSFRLDGVFLPPNPTGIVYFCEVQFQLDELLYERMLSEISIYIYRHRYLFADWRAVAIYPSWAVEQPRLEVVREMLASGRIVRVYLDELGKIEQLSTGLGLMRLTTLTDEVAVEKAKWLIEQSRSRHEGRAIIDLVVSIMVGKLTNLNREEVEAMFDIEIQETRLGRDIREYEGKKLVLRQLTCKLGNLSPQLQAQVNSLNLEQIESLGEALLDFTSIEDLSAFLANS